MNHAEIPFVSVVIPTRNRRELLKDAIESVFHQSYPKDRYEIIVIDNASTDGTEKMIQSIQNGAPCILKYECKENEGPGISRNAGIAKAGEGIVAFTDSDCVADKNWLRNGVAKMTDGVGLVQGKTLPNRDQTRRALQHTIDIRGENGFYETCNVFYRKEILDRMGGFSPDFCGLDLLGRTRWGGEDTDLAWRVKKQGWRSVFADGAIVYHHVFHLSPLKAIFSSYQLTGIIALPRTIKRHPELRDIVLYRKFFKRKQRFFFYVLMLSLLSGLLIHWGFFLLVIPYVLRLLRVSFHRRPIWSFHRGVALFSIIFLNELIDTVLSICTSLIYRTVVL